MNEAVMKDDTNFHLVFKFVIAFLLLSCEPVMASASIPTQNILGDNISLKNFQMGYFIDKSESMQFVDAKNQEYILSNNGLSLGTHSKFTWVKIKLKNDNPYPTNVYLHHPYAYHNSTVELYEMVDDELIRSRILDMDIRESQEWMYRGSAVFDISLAASQQKTLYVKSVAFSHQWFELNIYDESLSKRALLGQYTDIALLVGMLIALIVYNFLLFLYSRLLEHFYYACYLVSGGFWIALSYGLLADLFDVYGTITLKWHLSLVSMPIFILLFMISIFETKKKYPIEHTALSLVLGVLIIEFVYGLFDIITALKYSSTIATIMMLVSLSVTLSMVVRKQPIAKYFLVGHCFFIVLSGVSILFYKGLIAFTYVASHGVGIGIVLEALVLSLIIAYRIKSMEQMKVNQQNLQLLAVTDPLTQLYNRRYFNEESNEVIKRAKNKNKKTTIILLDIDNFKSINDSYGHAVGDEAIREVSNIIKNQSRQEDILARYGGEEFIMLMPEASINDTYKLAERIRISLEKTKIEITNNTSIYVTISIGVSEVCYEESDIQESINKADKALYEAKNNGRNQTRIFTS